MTVKWFWRKQKVHTPASFRGSGPVGNIGGEVIPDKIGTEPITGFRTWHVTISNQGAALKSLHRGYYWDTQNTAKCLPGFSVVDLSHRSPDPDCACGLYAQLPEHPLGEWEVMRVGRVSATGTVSMSGRIIVCERGYKAEHAEIIPPVVLDVSCAKGGCMVDVNRIQLAEPHHPMLGWCPEHTGETPEAVTVPSGVWLNQTCDQLAERYGIEFITWQ